VRRQGARPQGKKIERRTSRRTCSKAVPGEINRSDVALGGKVIYSAASSTSRELRPAARSG